MKHRKGNQNEATEEQRKGQERVHEMKNEGGIMRKKS